MESLIRGRIRKLMEPEEWRYARLWRGADRAARRAFSRGEVVAPPFYQVLLSVNNVCNFHCVSCDVGVDPEGQYSRNLHPEGGQAQLSYAEFTGLLDSVKSFRPELFIVGTEPTLYPRLVDFLAHARGAGLRTQFTTNGWLLGNLAEDLVRIRHNLVNVSIDCGVPEINDKVRGKQGALAKALDGIRALTESKRTRRSLYPLIQVNSVVSDYTYEHLVDTVRALEDLEIDVLCFSHLQCITPGMAEANNRAVPQYPALRSNITEVHPDRVDIATLRAQVRAVRETFPHLKISFRPDVPETELERYYHRPGEVLDHFRSCDILWRNIEIMSNGDALPIQRCFVKPLGNIRQKTAMEIWNDRPWQELRAAIVRHGGAFPACTRCSGLWC